MAGVYRYVGVRGERLKFTVYIDESGEAGISKIRDESGPGASKYFVLGAVIVHPDSIVPATEKLREIRDILRKQSWRHATDLDHSSKVYIAREMGSLHLRYFGVISNKFTLGTYKGFINSEPQKYYNKCLVYLLERVCSFLNEIGVKEDDLSFVLERRNHNYSAMINYIRNVRDRPLYTQSHSLKILNPFAITTKKKGEDALLDYADFVSYALYQCVNKTPSNFYIPETRYFEELMPRFGCDRKGLVEGMGLKYIHNLNMLAVDPKVANLFKSARATPPR